MVAVMHPYEVDLPGELHPAPAWEEVIEADCGLCGRIGADTGTGLCRCCLDRTPRAGGCGKAATVAVAVLGGEAGPGAARSARERLADAERRAAILRERCRLHRAAVAVALGTDGKEW